MVASYNHAESWFLADDRWEQPFPVSALRWIDASEAEDPHAAFRAEVEAAGQFWELWNSLLYKHSEAARNYREAQRELGKAFLHQEKALHPERYSRAYDRTPDGMVLIQGGSFTLGPMKGYLAGQRHFEKERRERIRSFYLDRHEVTCGEYALFLLALPSSLQDEHIPLGWERTQSGEPILPADQTNHPVAGVTWESARSYARWVGKRLPTEDEWEVAAGGTDRTRYPIGSQFRTGQVNCAANRNEGPLPALDYPGDYTDSGLRSMTGNLSEWTSSDRTGKRIEDPDTSTLAAVRGGSYQDGADRCETRHRWLQPALGTRDPAIGFRCALDAR